MAVWSILVLLSALAQREQLNRAAAELARIDAVANLKKDMAIRKWASGVEGVFIREERVPPINSLDEEERLTAIRGNGEQLRLVSVTPIHLLLAIQGQTNADSGSKERLTSKQLRNIQNAPDEWEKQALEALNRGAQMVTENLPKKGGHGLMRAMIPMKMEAECLECHRDTLVPVGGLRGGASVSIDLNTYRSAQEPTWQAIRLWHGGIWLLGIATILLLHYISRRRAADLQRVDEARRENETAFAAMAEGAVITDADATILWVNDAFCRISGYERHEVVGSNPRMLKSGLHDSNFYAALWRQLSETGHWRGEIWNRRKNGEIFPEEISMQALRGPNGKIRRYISIFSDITERKKNETELARHREHLEDLVRQRTEELTIARDQAEAANRSKSLFLANMSHELRTPLNAVIGFSQLMENDPSLSAAQQHRLEIINHSGHHLLTLINDILELSKIESGKMKLSPEEVDLEHLLEQVVDMMRLRAEQLGLYLALETDRLAPVVVDPGMLRQVMLNLLSNALKFTPTGQVTVSARGTPIDAGQIRLEFGVRDTGIGISPEDCQRIFSSFEQVGSAHQGGTGLGLSISRRYVQMMGGELTVDSVPGKGSHFYFTIVATIADMAPPQRLHPDILRLPPGEHGKRILIVDDGLESRLLVRSLLEPIGFAIVEAT
ncbi:MAG: PAS domain S-box protein, partial [Betaproteobacteria bacterium]|nr:PAS domain S-box protein [Betaproteobacteria bacterium]